MCVVLTLLCPQEMDIEVDENGTLDLSMKKPIKREGSLSGTSPGIRSPDPSSSSSSSVHHSGITSPNLLTYKQEWEGPLDYTKPNRQREEDVEEVGFEFPPLQACAILSDLMEKRSESSISCPLGPNVCGH